MPEDGLAGAPDGTQDGGRGGGGDSGGGPYPNPHTGKKPKNDFEGGQSDKGYHGSHQLGSEGIEGKDNPNAATRSD